MVTALRAAWLRFKIRREEVRRQIACDDALYHRQRARLARPAGDACSTEKRCDRRAFNGYSENRVEIGLAQCAH